jgi:hypothetical protein
VDKKIQILVGKGQFLVEDRQDRRIFRRGLPPATGSQIRT